MLSSQAASAPVAVDSTTPSIAPDVTNPAEPQRPDQRDEFSSVLGPAKPRQPPQTIKAARRKGKSEQKTAGKKPAAKRPSTSSEGEEDRKEEEVASPPPEAASPQPAPVLSKWNPADDAMPPPLFTLNAQQLHALAKHAHSLHTATASEDDTHFASVEQFRCVTSQVYYCLTEGSDFNLNMPPTISRLPANSPNLGQCNLSYITSFSGQTQAPISIKRNLSITLFAWVYAHELTHISVRLMQLLHRHDPVHFLEGTEKQKIEGLCELSALLCTLSLCIRHPTLYAQSYAAHRLQNWESAHCSVAASAPQNEPAAHLYTYREQVVNVYAGGLKFALAALLANPQMDFATFACYFLSSAHVTSVDCH